MVRPGGIIAFHDVFQGYLNEEKIFLENYKLGCAVLWEELKDRGDLVTDEYTVANGMGVIFK